MSILVREQCLGTGSTIAHFISPRLLGKVASQKIGAREGPELLYGCSNGRKSGT